MNVRQCAEKIVKYLSNVLDTWPGYQAEEAIQNEIAAEMEAYASERSAAAVEEVKSQCSLAHQEIEVIRAEAYEDAAKILDAEASRYTRKASGHSKVTPLLQAKWEALKRAKRVIRARAAEVK